MAFFIGCGMVVACGDKFVLVRETRGEAKRGLYSMPGGTLEPDEDLLVCVQREVHEEIGLALQPDRLLGVYQLVISEGQHNVLFFVFAAEAPADAVFSSEEHDEIRTFSYDEVVAMDAAGQLRAPTVLQAIDAYRAGTSHPLSLIRALYVERFGSVTVRRS